MIRTTCCAILDNPAAGHGNIDISLHKDRREIAAFNRAALHCEYTTARGTGIYVDPVSVSRSADNFSGLSGAAVPEDQKASISYFNNSSIQIPAGSVNGVSGKIEVHPFRINCYRFLRRNILQQSNFKLFHKCRTGVDRILNRGIECRILLKRERSHRFPDAGIKGHVPVHGVAEVPFCIVGIVRVPALETITIRDVPNCWRDDS